MIHNFWMHWDAMQRCNRPPRGWYCPCVRGHAGPCPTYPRWWNVRGQLAMRRVI